MRFTCAEITRGPKTPEAVLRRRVSAAGKRLRKLGITRAVLPEDFAYQELLERQGIRAVSTVTLRRALAADWARAVMETGRFPRAMQRWRWLVPSSRGNWCGP